MSAAQGRQLFDESSTLKCALDMMPHPAGTEFASVDFEFWYAVGFDEYISPRSLFDIEQLLYTSIEQDTLWCTEIVEQKTSPDSRTRRRDQAGVRRLGVVTCTPGKKDEETYCT